MLVKYLRKNTQDRRFIFCQRTLGINVEKNCFCRNLDAVFQLGIHHGIIKFICKVLHRLFSADRLIGKQIGEYLQKVRFTASKETRDPHTDFVGRLLQRALIVIQKSIEMPAQFLCDNVFRQFLYHSALIVLCHFNDTVDVTVDVLFIDTLQFHGKILL